MNEARLFVLLQQMRDAAVDAQNFVEGLDHSDFLEDPKTQNAVVMALVRVGTNASRIMKDYPDIATRVPSIPWPLVRGMRNHIAHDNERLDMEVIWATVKEDVPGLIDGLEKALKDGALVLKT